MVHSECCKKDWLIVSKAMFQNCRLLNIYRSSPSTKTNNGQIFPCKRTLMIFKVFALDARKTPGGLLVEILHWWHLPLISVKLKLIAANKNQVWSTTTLLFITNNNSWHFFCIAKQNERPDARDILHLHLSR